MNSKMKTVRKEMTAGDLKGIIDLPNYEDNQRVEIKIAPAEPEERKKMSREEIEAALNKLTGCLKGLVDPTKDMAYWRSERLAEKHGLKFAD